MVHVLMIKKSPSEFHCFAIFISQVARTVTHEWHLLHFWLLILIKKGTRVIISLQCFFIMYMCSV